MSKPAPLHVHNSKPTPERAAKSPVRLSPKTIADARGNIAQPYLTLDVLDRMEKRGTISRPMHAAGTRFREDFRLAHLDPLRAAPLEGAARSSDHVPVSETAERARRRVADAMAVFGGRLSPAGSCVWAVIGEERTLKDWAGANGWGCRAVSEEASSGVLISALCALAAHYGH